MVQGDPPEESQAHGSPPEAGAFPFKVNRLAIDLGLPI